MNQFDQPIDYTGYGPTSAGRAPSAHELRQANYNRYHTSRAAEAMRFIDPQALAAAERIVRLGSGKDRSPEAIRRNLFGTASGQATLDAAMAGRKSGVIGYGDPTQYSANVAQMVSGGFRTNILQSIDGNQGRMAGFSQRVAGNGILAERATIGAQKALLDSLYGAGQSQDPSKLNGYDMAQASNIAKRVVGQVGMGQLMGIKQNASFSERLKSAQDSEVDPLIKEAFANMTDEQKTRAANIDATTDPAKKEAEIEKLAAELESPQARAALKDVMKSTDAIVFNEAAVKKVGETVKEVTKGMAALSDIYGGLSDDEAFSLLEQVSGGRITNKAQARAAAKTVDNMRNAAEYAGIDPRQLFAMMDAQGQGLGEQIGAKFNTDTRDRTSNTRMKQKLAAQNAIDATYAAKMINEGRKSMSDAGVAGFEGEGRTAEEYASDRAQRQVETAEIYKGRILANSDMAGFTKEQKARAKDLAAQMDALDTSTAAGRQEAQILDSQIRDLAGPDFEAYINSGQGQVNLNQGMENSEDFIDQKSNEALVGNQSLLNVLADRGLSKSQGRDVNRIALKKLGAAGLARYADIGRMQNKEERDAAREQLMEESGITEQEQSKLDSGLLDAEGRTTDVLNDYTKVMENTDRSGGVGTTYYKAQVAKDRLNNLQKNNNRQLMRDDEGSISMRGIARAIFSDKVRDPFSDMDTTAATLDAMQGHYGKGSDALMVDVEEEVTDANGKKSMQKVKRNLADMYESNIDISKGFTAENLEKFDKIAGGKVNLRDRVNKALGMNMTDEEFLEKSKTDARIQDASYTALADAGETMGFQIGGAKDSVAVGRKNISDLARQQLAEPLKKTAALQAYAPFMSKDQLKEAETKVLAGGDPGIGDLFKADEYDAADWFSPDDQENREDDKGNEYKAARMNRGEKFRKLSDTIRGADEEKLGGMAKMAGAEDVLEGMKNQAQAMADAIADGSTKMITFDDQGNEIERDLGAEQLAEMQASIAKFASAIEQQSGSGGVQKVGTMTVTKLEVTGDFNSEKK